MEGETPLKHLSHSYENEYRLLVISWEELTSAF